MQHFLPVFKVFSGNLELYAVHPILLIYEQNILKLKLQYSSFRILNFNIQKMCITKTFSTEEG